MRTISTADALFSKTRQGILAATFLQPEKWWYLRELASHLKTPPSSLQRELASLVKGGILQRKTEGKHVYFQPEAQSPIYADLRGLIIKSFGVRDELTKVLERVPGIRRAFIYGSFATGTEAAHSDIDVCLIIEKGKFKSEKVLMGFKDLEGKLGREISYVFYTLQEWENGLKNKDSFMNGLNKGKKIELVKHDKTSF